MASRSDMPLIPITDPADPRLDPYLRLRERDLVRGHGGRFIVEGKVTLAALVQSGNFPIESVFIAEHRQAPLAELLDKIDAHVPVYVAPQRIMDEVAGFPMHRGVLACGQKTPTPSLETQLAALKAVSLVLVLSGLSNHDNVGACFRNAAAFGADLVVLDEMSCDPLYRKAIRVSAGAVLSQPFRHAGKTEEQVEALKAAGFQIWCLTPKVSAEPLNELEIPERVALVLGAEGPGLPDDILTSGQLVRIPMAAGFDSVNVATAGAIAMSAVFSQRDGSGQPGHSAKTAYGRECRTDKHH